MPAAGQGALALEARVGELAADPRLDAARDPAAGACVSAERTLVHALGASCQTPVGAHARRRGDGCSSSSAWVGLPDGSEWLRDEVAGPAEDVGALCAERMLAAGARELLDRAEQQVVAVTVYLVGAGPGDPGLLTARALELIAARGRDRPRPADPRHRA